VGKPGTSAAVSAREVWGQPLTSSRPPCRARLVRGSTPIFTFIVVACLARSGWLITKWLFWLWLWQGRASLVFRDVLRCLAGAWQALGFLAATRWERDSAIFLPKVILRWLGLESTSVYIHSLQGGGNRRLICPEQLRSSKILQNKRDAGLGWVREGARMADASSAWAIANSTHLPWGRSSSVRIA